MRETVGVQDALGYVVVGVVAVAAVIAVVALVGAGRVYDEIGRGGLSLRDEAERTETAADRDEEVRQLLRARSDRRVARGLQPVDVEAELRRLTAPAAGADPALREEVRQLVVASNERRVRQGRAPLDVEAEIERRLRDLGTR